MNIKLIISQPHLPTLIPSHYASPTSRICSGRSFTSLYPHLRQALKTPTPWLSAPAGTTRASHRYCASLRGIITTQSRLLVHSLHGTGADAHWRYPIFADLTTMLLSDVRFLSLIRHVLVVIWSPRASSRHIITLISPLTLVFSAWNFDNFNDFNSYEYTILRNGLNCAHTNMLVAFKNCQTLLFTSSSRSSECPATRVPYPP